MIATLTSSGGTTQRALALHTAEDRDRVALALLGTTRVEQDHPVGGGDARHRRVDGHDLPGPRNGEGPGRQRQILEQRDEIAVGRGLVDQAQSLLVLDRREPALDVGVAQQAGDTLAVGVRRAQAQGVADRVRSAHGPEVIGSPRWPTVAR